jgi:DNA repair ATPase RecN
MKQFKDVNACMAELQALLARSDIGPEQKKDVEAAIEHLRRLRRKPSATMPDVYRCVRNVASRLISAFVK